MNDEGRRSWFAHPMLIGFNEGLMISMVLLVSLGQALAMHIVVICQTVLSLVGATLMSRASYLTFLDEVGEAGRRDARTASFWVGLGYILGGIIPILLPLLFPTHPMKWTVIISMGLLAIFSYIKGFFSETGPFSRMLLTLVIAALAAVSAFYVARLFIRH